MILRKLSNLLRRRRYLTNWRKINAHNETYPLGTYPDNLVTIGAYTYGGIKIQHYGTFTEKVEIGSFCSIAGDVEFNTGGGHKLDKLVSFPLNNKINGKNETISKGPIIIKDDVWIGRHAIIMSGVTVGQGAVIGSCAVVARDVPPYAIVVGNPAKIIRYRFAEDMISKLLKLDFSKLASLPKDELSQLYNTEINAIDFKKYYNEICEK